MQLHLPKGVLAVQFAEDLGPSELGHRFLDGRVTGFGDRDQCSTPFRRLSIETFWEAFLGVPGSRGRKLGTDMVQKLR
ncbi:hypothetical protein B566_EDAN014463, partial [Ephemera danica]